MTEQRTIRFGRLSAYALAAGLIGLIAVANVHLVYVAQTSDPGCVAHRIVPEADGRMLRAARSDC